MVDFGDLQNWSKDVAGIAVDPGGMAVNQIRAILGQAKSQGGGGGGSADQFNRDNPQFAQQEKQGGAGDSSVISFDGIHLLDGTTVSWQQLASMSDPDAAKALTKGAGLNAQEANQLVLTLRKNKNIVWNAEDPGNFNSLKTWSDPAFRQLADQSGQTVAQEKTHNLATSIGGGDPQQQTTNPPMSAEALETYRQAMVMPLLQHYQNIVNGDMAQWGSMIGQIKKDTAGADTNFATPNLQLLGQLQNLYGQSSITNQAMGPYFQMMDKLAGANLQIGLAKESLGANESLLQQTAAQSPALQQILNASSGIQGLSGSSSQGVSSLIQAVNGANPQQKPIAGA